MSNFSSVTGPSDSDVIDQLLGFSQDDPMHVVRYQRDKVVAATQGSYDGLFDPALPGLGLAERLLVALLIARLSGSGRLEAHYLARLNALHATSPLSAAEQRALDANAVSTAPQDDAFTGAEDARLRAILTFAHTLALRPVEGDRDALLRLPEAGLTTPEVVVLAQLIAFVAYQVRVVAGLQALGQLSHVSESATASSVAGDTSPFVHPAHLPKPGEPVRVNGFTSETLGWKAWLPVVALDQATPEQIAVLEASHPAAKTSDYYRVLVHQPRILQERSIAFNAIMYAPGGLSRAERELASAVVSRVNRCVYCASVHAQRFEQLAKRNDVIYQVFADPQGAGTNAREKAIVQASIDLTSAPGQFGPDQLRPVKAAGLSTLEIIDLIHAIAIFAWANRLMLNLGEAVIPSP
ncbi:peroxidase-related enzyme [Acidovorax sp. DW039]|uniref:CMD domain protein n=1 Tax=Acidovorax sp. DW039 TaxID=3095606 RepID=UPI003084CA53|nr:peroxidase-related enzyme [Acidovorax sp. DW039]